MIFPRQPGWAQDQSYTKLRSRLQTSRRHRIPFLTQTKPQSQTTPQSNQNQSLILNVDLVKIIINQTIVPKGMQAQQIAGETLQARYALKKTFSIFENVKKVFSSIDSIVSGKMGVAGTKPLNIQTAPCTQFQRNLIRELKVKMKRGNAPVKGKATGTNSFVAAHQNQSEDYLR
ncbi:MAG: hypothetical protein EZS28_025092 [Streblomastix strix]|uniref:Uncharacterized protein n=1 Tax=Streblomastix strix TaxID=222440 RepID=A0A5J4VAB4_9EUKA|nr:MAG: hypothetical protein EZS28_025092 [Streblomastix strix]